MSIPDELEMSVTGVAPDVVKALQRAAAFAAGQDRRWIGIEDLLMAVIATSPLEMWWPREGQGMLDGGRIADPDIGNHYLKLTYRELTQLVAVMVPPAPDGAPAPNESPEVRYTVAGPNADQITAWIDEPDTTATLAAALYGDDINDPRTPPQPPYMQDTATAWVQPAHLDEAAAYVSSPDRPAATWQVATRDSVPGDAVKHFRADSPGIVVDEVYSASLLAMFAGKLVELDDDTSIAAIVWSAKTAGMGYWLPNVAVYTSDNDRHDRRE
ncbi:hypothetical protein [Nocardia wallacei]|uniref:hypothetical protein n=1 Tax=Nocardia wallacei TaxID=480035 RepID=UPI0024541CE3|nr:hypothetical protein [Nocardia wallacei]